MTVSVVILASALALQAAPAAAPGSYPQGQLIDPVVSTSNPAQRYVLFVPKGASAANPRPILYILDYRGRGRVAAELFRPAAERMGWILMSSYNAASDGPAEPTALALKAMWRDSHDRLPIDGRRAYLAGLSGTARFATLVAARAGAGVTGVIGSAAGFHPDVEPAGDLPFVYYGAAGSEDYNYWEMQVLATRLEKVGLPHRVAFFDGPHRWLTEELAEAALAWMDLRAMRAGTLERDESFVEARWTRDLARALALEERGLMWEASRLLASVADDYRGLRPAREVDTARRRARELGSTPAAQAQARRQAREATAHDLAVERALQTLAEAYPENADAPASPPARAILDLGIERLKRAAAGPDAGQALAARRILAQLDVQTGFYLPLGAIARGDDGRARYYLTIAEAIRADDPYAWYLRAVVEARRGQAARAVAALDRAIEHGFRTVDAVEHHDAFDPLRRRDDFQRIVQRLGNLVR